MVCSRRTSVIRHEKLRQAVEALATGPGPIQPRLQAAESFFHEVDDRELRTDPERHLNLRIGAHLVGAAPDSDENPDEEAEADPATRARWTAALSDAQAAEIACDLFKLYELVAGLRDPDREWPNKRF